MANWSKMAEAFGRAVTQARENGIAESDILRQLKQLGRD